MTLGGQIEHLALCGGCAALIPASNKAQAKHRDFHGAVEAALPR